MTFLLVLNRISSPSELKDVGLEKEGKAVHGDTHLYSSTPEAEGGGPRVLGQRELHGEALKTATMPCG